jgi:ATP-dependent protease ClpP protease subunit
VLNYLKAHWRGDLSLARSYWINGIAFNVVLNVGAAALGSALTGQSVDHVLFLTPILVVLVISLALWQLVGIWRSASRSSEQTGRRLWPHLAKAATCQFVFAIAVDLVTASLDLTRTWSSIHDPVLNTYTIERPDETSLLITGVINQRSADEVMQALADPAITVLRVKSPGGLIYHAIQLARYIRQRELTVLAEEVCSSACVMLLAASPRAGIRPDTDVTFHRPEPVAKLVNAQVRRQSEVYLAEANEIYSELGLAPWTIETAARHQFWTPRIDQLIRMGLIDYIYDEASDDFVPAHTYCTSHVQECY